MPMTLEERFHEALVKTNEIAKQECGHDPKVIKRMMAEHGAVQTAKKLMKLLPNSSGFLVAAECGRLDITVEATMLRQEFKSLFTQDELNQARARLPTEIVASIESRQTKP